MRFHIAPIIVIVFSISNIIFLQKDQITTEKEILNKTAYLQEEKFIQIETKLLGNLPHFGFQNLVADLLYLKYIQYFGDTEAREETGYGVSADFFKGVVKQDPRFVNAHLKLAPGTSLFAGFPDVSVDLIDESFKFITPETLSTPYPAYYLLIYKGTDEMLFLSDYEGAKKSFLTAAQWAEMDTLNPEEGKQVAQSLRNRVKFLETQKPDSLAARIGAWTLVLSVNSDPQTVERVVREIEKLGGKVTISPDGVLRVRVPEED